MSQIPLAWALSLPSAPYCLCFEPADPDRHAVLLHDWLHRPHVAPWWGPDKTLAETRDYILRQRCATHLTPWMVSLWGKTSADDTLFGYVETYRAAEDRLAQFTALNDSDRGWHVLVGLREMLGSGVPRLMGRAVLAQLLSEPGVERVVCEPNAENLRMLGYCEALGFRRLATLDLPEKTAALMGYRRVAFEARWPGDLAAARAARVAESGAA